ncbi:translation initiation factor IF-2 subunit alpha [Nanoarchaeota archaeon]
MDLLYKKKGTPEVNEIVMCLVKMVKHTIVFVSLEEYQGQNGVIHISEISPGRIRNIRDFVKEGKMIVCKVLRYNKERNQIDLSLRRVNESQRKNKVNELKQEQKSEKIVEFVANLLKLEFKQLYLQLTEKIFKEYENLSFCFEDVAVDNIKISELGIEDKLAEKLTEVIKQRIKPPEVKLHGEFLIESYESNGVEIIKEILSKIDTYPDTDIRNLGAGKYSINITSTDYKTGEKKLKKIIDEVMEYMEKYNGISEFNRLDKKND